jgi:hypothetical protein
LSYPSRVYDVLKSLFILSLSRIAKENVAFHSIMFNVTL